ncbi:FliI/YscN family ATPase [Pseudoxanthomonas sp. SORGH_AS_0997]|uniref:FliI/YscN family ATPase n=1 Tax=Pseudoxanthomonas sp. SORGH_AS_0997 TaxID=3041776 RepID=UPI002862BD21|nr:FliI/YscN family ATPase [Pseudoxanthomonas sp. SORGH_AS_0997]MDR6139874.1 flagellum-specific ATP synthase [Pseudoxanthomonas sp. SORGH_AS_0997]
MDAFSTRVAGQVSELRFGRKFGQVTGFNGLVVEAQGPHAGIGEVCLIDLPGGDKVISQVVGLRSSTVLLMPYQPVERLCCGARVWALGKSLDVPVGRHQLGRVINAFGESIDGLPELVYAERRPQIATAIPPLERVNIDQVLETGLSAVDGLLTIGKGQRVGIFAGSGVGKSTLLGTIASHAKVDVTVIALIGERGREVGDFVRHTLGPAGLERAVVVAATAEEAPLVRVLATRTAHVIAEYFRDQGLDVLLVVDSMTRFAMAQREIGLAAGEPPTFRGYTPSVFAQLPQLVERCGRNGTGSITGIYSVLVEGDDMNEPVTDHMRAILDGHIVLDRKIASRGHYPAIDILHSASRLLPNLAGPEALQVAADVKRVLAVYEASRDLIELGAYQAGRQYCAG